MSTCPVDRKFMLCRQESVVPQALRGASFLSTRHKNPLKSCDFSGFLQLFQWVRLFDPLSDPLTDPFSDRRCWTYWTILGMMGVSPVENNTAYQEEVWTEIIGGKVIAISPRPSVNHHRVSLNIANIFSRFLKGKTYQVFGDGVDLFLSDQNRFIPDGMIVCDPGKVKRDGVYGTPDLVIEVLSPSTARYDRGPKKDAYEAAGVREYWIIEPEVKSFEVYLLKDGKLVLDDVYSVYPDYLLEKMSDEEKAAVPTAFRCSLYDGLTINLEDVFADTF